MGTSPGFGITVIFVLSIVGIIWWFKYHHYRLFRWYSPELVSKIKNPPTKTSTSGTPKSRRVIIASLIRDGSKKISRIRKTIENITQGWSDWRYLVVENDSEDDTRDKLLKWASEESRVVVLGCGINVNNCKLGLKRTTGHDVYSSRIQKMVYLRNLYINTIVEDQNMTNFDYLLVWDPDLDGYFEPDDTDDTLDYLDSVRNISAACAHGYYPLPMGGKLYFDTYAHVDLDKPLDDGDMGLLRSNLIKFDAFQWEPDPEPYEVRSCFGGLTAYRISDIIKAKARYLFKIGTNKKPLCEHTTFNEQLKGKKVVMKTWPYIIFKNK